METAAPGLEGKLPLVSAPAPPPPPSDAHVQHLQQGVFAPHQRAQLPTLAAQRRAGAASQAQTIQASAQVSSRVQSITVSQSPVSSAFPRPRPASRVSQALRFPPQLPLQTGRTTATTDQLRQRYKKNICQAFYRLAHLPPGFRGLRLWTIAVALRVPLLGLLRQTSPSPFAA